MCLSNLFNLADFLKDHEATVGYKVFHECYGEDEYIGIHAYVTQIFRLNDWAYDNSNDYIGVGILARSVFGDIKYKAGYHIFVHLKDAIDYFESMISSGRKQLVLAEVLYNDIVCVGSQHFVNNEANIQDGLCVVAKEMKIAKILCCQLREEN